MREPWIWLRRKKKALEIFQWLAGWGDKRIAYGECGEGILFARSLIADCYYRIARIHQERRERDKAKRAYRQHLLRRKHGVRSIYPLSEVKRQYASLLTEADPSHGTLAAGSRFAHARKRLKLSPAGPMVLRESVWESRNKSGATPRSKAADKSVHPTRVGE
jgi:hypothetical protein